jgi:quinol monooxygenase YgiN
MSHPIPPVAAVIAHRVADFQSWKNVFDSDVDTRRSAGILGHHINRDADDPNLITVYLPATDADKLESMFQSPELKAKMAEAGVEGRPEIKVMAPQSESLVRDRLTAGAIITHEVADYARWRDAFDSDEEHRANAGLLGSAVNRGAANPSEVTVYLQAGAIDDLRAYVASDHLKAKMKDAGVAGPPTIRFVEGSEWGQYGA